MQRRDGCRISQCFTSCDHILAVPTGGEPRPCLRPRPGFFNGGMERSAAGDDQGFYRVLYRNQGKDHIKSNRKSRLQPGSYWARDRGFGISLQIGARVANVSKNHPKAVVAYVPDLMKYEVIIRGFELNGIPAADTIEEAVQMLNGIRKRSTTP